MTGRAGDSAVTAGAGVLPGGNVIGAHDQASWVQLRATPTVGRRHQQKRRREPGTFRTWEARSADSVGTMLRPIAPRRGIMKAYHEYAVHVPGSRQ